MGTQVAPQEFDVLLGTATARLLAANSARKFLQIQNRGSKAITVKYGADFTPAYNAVQTLTVTAEPTAGTATLKYGAATVMTLIPGTDATAIQTAMDAVVGAGNSVVTGSWAAGFVFTFTGTLAGAPGSVISVATSTLTNEDDEVSAIQNISFSAIPSAGTFTVAFGANVTPALPWDTDQDELKNALNALASINGGVASVSRDLATGNFSVTFGSPLDNRPLALMVVVSSLTNTTSVASEIDQIWAVPRPLQGTYQLMIPSLGTTAELAYNASAAAVRTALEALVGAGNVTVAAMSTDTRLDLGYRVAFGGPYANVSLGMLAQPNTATPMHPDIYAEPQKRVPDDVRLAIKVQVAGASPVAVTATVSTLRAGVAPVACAPVVAQTVVGAPAPTEGFVLQAMGADQGADMVMVETAVPITEVWAVAQQASNPVSVWEG